MTDQEIEIERDEQGRILPGCAFWRSRETHGRNRLYSDPEDLWEACCGYFEATVQSPLIEDKVYSSEGRPVHVQMAKMRPFTLTGLCFHLRIADETWREWRNNREDLQPVIATVEQVIYVQKFEVAASGLLNPTVISRDLGLAEKRELSGPDGQPLPAPEVSNLEVARRLAFILQSGAIQAQEQ